MRLIFEIPGAPRHPDMTDDEYSRYAESWGYDATRDIVAAAEALGGKLVGGGP